MLNKRSKFSALKLSVQLRDDQLSYFSPTIQFVCWSTSSSLFYSSSSSSSSFQRIRWIEFSSHRDKHPNRHKLPTPLGAYFLSSPQFEAQPSLSPGSKDHQFSITRNRAGAGNLSVSIPFSLSDQKTNQSLKHVLPFRFPRQLFSLLPAHGEVFKSDKMAKTNNLRSLPPEPGPISSCCRCCSFSVRFGSTSCL